MVTGLGPGLPFGASFLEGSTGSGALWGGLATLIATMKLSPE